MAPGPKMCGLEMAGDSMLLRLSKVHADNKRECRGNSKKWGLCTSGRTTKELLKDISSLNGSAKPSIVLMVGTNDVLRIAKGKENLEKQKHAIGCELRKLKEKLCRDTKRVFWCTLPQIPLLERSEDGETRQRYLRTFQMVNSTIQTFGGERCTVIRLDNLFQANGQTMESYYERFMGTGSRIRKDGIHWNHIGMTLAARKIKDTIENTE